MKTNCLKDFLLLPLIIPMSWGCKWGYSHLTQDTHTQMIHSYSVVLIFCCQDGGPSARGNNSPLASEGVSDCNN